MLHKLRDRAASEKGFTLIELLVVILIIGILAAIALPAFLNQRSKAQDTEAKSAARTAQTAMETFYTDEQTYVGADPHAEDRAATAPARLPRLLRRPLVDTIPRVAVDHWQRQGKKAANGSGRSAEGHGYQRPLPDEGRLQDSYSESRTSRHSSTGRAAVRRSRSPRRRDGSDQRARATSTAAQGWRPTGAASGRQTRRTLTAESRTSPAWGSPILGRARDRLRPFSGNHACWTCYSPPAVRTPSLRRVEEVRVGASRLVCEIGSGSVGRLPGAAERLRRRPVGRPATHLADRVLPVAGRIHRPDLALAEGVSVTARPRARPRRTRRCRGRCRCTGRRRPATTRGCRRRSRTARRSRRARRR